ncbi:MAG: hypothetical protein MZV49_09995 [Rhodopseudomonas palustris]|nr:hypothetical protein [Rhodopseudomonas palustris]
MLIEGSGRRSRARQRSASRPRSAAALEVGPDRRRRDRAVGGRRATASGRCATTSSRSCRCGMPVVFDISLPIAEMERYVDDAARTAARGEIGRASPLRCSGTSATATCTSSSQVPPRHRWRAPQGIEALVYEPLAARTRLGLGRARHRAREEALTAASQPQPGRAGRDAAP